MIPVAMLLFMIALRRLVTLALDPILNTATTDRDNAGRNNARAIMALNTIKSQNVMNGEYCHPITFAVNCL